MTEDQKRVDQIHSIMKDIKGDAIFCCFYGENDLATYIHSEPDLQKLVNLADVAVKDLGEMAKQHCNIPTDNFRAGFTLGTLRDLYANHGLNPVPVLDILSNGDSYVWCSLLSHIKAGDLRGMNAGGEVHIADEDKSAGTFETMYATLCVMLKSLVCDGLCADELQAAEYLRACTEYVAQEALYNAKKDGSVDEDVELDYPGTNPMAHTVGYTDDEDDDL